MSLKAFHAVFIVICFVFSTYFGGWCVSQYNSNGSVGMLVAAFGSFFVATGLSLYLVWFLKKYKQIGFLVVGLWLLSCPKTIWACSVCLGDPNAPMVKSVNSGVWFLLGVITTLLVGFASLFLFWRKRAAQLAI
jgi:hypothetical protein